MTEGRGAGEPVVDAAAVEADLAAGPLTEGQREAVRTILLTGDRVVGVEGRAGSGKTAMLRETARLAGETKVVGLAPSQAAVGALEREAGIPARTLQWFLARHRDIGDRMASPERLAEARMTFGGAVLAVDEASMVSAAQMRQLMRIAERIGIARLALVGDSRQLRSVEAGQPFRQLQQAGMATARMDEILRQRDPDLRAAVAAMLEDGPAEAVERLGNNVHEAEADELGEAAARLWLSLHPEARARTAILAPTHALREDINEAVREGLRGEGVLHGRVLEIERLVGLGLTRAQKADIAGYRPGDVLVFHNDLYRYRVKTDDACIVTGTDGEGRVLLHHPDGRPRRIDPSGPVRYRYELYETRPIRLQAGDRIRWTRNDGKRGLVNGGEAEVLAIGYRFVTLETDGGPTLSLRRDDPQLRHVDHAWSSTLHAAQGTTRDNAILALASDRGLPVDRAGFYVGISRARDRAVVLTDIRRYHRNARERFLTDDEIRRLSARLRAHEGRRPLQVAAIRLLLLIGCRKGEILSLRWTDYRDGHLFLRDSKTGPRTVWLSGPARSVLDGLERKSCWIFPAARGDRPRSATWLGNFWTGIRAETGLEDVRLHDLRHSMASLALRQGETVLAIGRLLGHRRPETTLKYIHFADAMARDAAETVGAVLGG
ncbi:MAG: AAA family ATPase [Alphaproteobacteria bacterium]|nr:AAA family ATPase [Alphaproteobacteria bacterium]